ncbi:hypothetical protein GCM10011574_39210 [Microbispora bryophytorum]|uniref:Uncharacterized protein n=1 Tax=Microbispora bryophytorum TaxID=1460882 RepID=A0A8H9H0P9_9ACTN|nr:hypothetical protein GCM10011574_39210 [Microbispora bryophytorum]
MAPASSYAEGFHDALVGHLTLPVDALGVDPEHHVYAMTGPLCGFRRVDSRIEPQRDGRRAQVVRPGRQGRGDLPGREGVAPGFLPDLRVGRPGDEPARPRTKQPSVITDAVPLDVLAEDGDQLGQDRYLARVLLAPMLEPANFR